MLSQSSSLIPVEKLISYRKTYGRRLQQRGQNNFFTPAWVKENFQDDDFRYFNGVDEFLFHEPILEINGNGAEFASRTLISPKYLQVLKGLAKTAQAKRKVSQNYNDRIERSQVRRIKPAEPALGKTANNLEIFEKQTRERRYRIQRFIQKNRLPGKRKCDCGAGHEKVYDCEKCRRPGNRICTCGQPVNDLINFKKNVEHGNVTAGGVATCGSVWGCPVCRSKIVDKRSKQLKEIYHKGTEKGYHFALVTFTIPHSGADNLAELYGNSTLGEGLSGAFTNFRRSHCYSKKFKKLNQFIGDIKAVEITWGQVNGFHPHIHFVVITENKIDAEKWERKFLKAWQKECIKAGLDMPNERGVKIDQCNAYDQVVYLAKWSVGSELQSDSAKKGKGLNHSIAELEMMLIDEYKRSSGMYPLSLDRICGVLSSYYKAMHGQKQLQYGNTKTGWKDEILGDDVEDQDITEPDEKTHLELLTLEKDLYQDLIRKDKLSEFIEGLEHLEGPGNISDLAYHKAKAMLFYMGFDDQKLHYPGQTIRFSDIQN